MKLLKVLTIVLFSLFLFFSVLFAQENETTDAGVNNQQQKSNAVNVPGAETEKNVSTEKTVIETVVPDQVNKKKNPVNESKNEKLKNVSKKNTEKKVTPASVEVVDVKEEKASQVKIDGDFLLINEGNFKYKRIPDIKLPDIVPQKADTNTPAVEAAGTGENPSTGFSGLSKTAMDIIVKGGVLLFILLIFILYKSRISHPGSKSSKKRNVLNSYRK